MHNMINSSGMDQESHLAPDNSFANEHWAGMNPYNQISISGYASDYFMSSNTHGLPSDSINSNRMAPPPIPQHLQQSQPQHHPNQHYANQIPHQLMIPGQVSTPQVSWPSLRTNPSQSYASPPVRIPPQAPPTVKQQPKLPSITTSTPRKTLTNDDRRRMCQYAEDHPKVKQTEIGLKFGVERSTVSKVLRKKDLYLNQDDRASSPVKKPKGKNAGELERTLQTWIRNQQRKGVVVNDEELESQARLLFAGTGTSESPEKVINKNWLDKFKQKNGLGPGKLLRRASETAIPDNIKLSTESPILSATQTPGGVSPTSPEGPTSPSLVSATPSNDEQETLAAAFSGFEGSHYKHSQSITSLNSAITDPSSSTFSAGAFSPTSQFTFSPDPNNGMFDQRRLPIEASAFHRPRSQTFPTLDIEFTQQQSSDPPTPKYSASTTAPSSALDSPAHELVTQPFSVDSTISPILHHSRSSSSLGGRSSNTPILPSAGVSSPSSPTQEDARRAADTLVNFMQGHGLMTNDEFTTLMRLTEKLRLHQQQHQPFKTILPAGMGGLPRIPEVNAELSHIGTQMIEKDESMMAG